MNNQFESISAAGNFAFQESRKQRNIPFYIYINRTGGVNYIVTTIRKGETPILKCVMNGLVTPLSDILAAEEAKAERINQVQNTVQEQVRKEPIVTEPIKAETVIAEPKIEGNVVEEKIEPVKVDERAISQNGKPKKDE